VTASDLAPAEIEWAKHEAAQRGLPIAFSVADMREVHHHHLRQGIPPVQSHWRCQRSAGV